MGGGETYSSIKHFSNRLLRLLFVFEPVSIVLKTLIFALEGRSSTYIVLRVIQSIVFYPYGALWYIQAMIVGIWMLYFLVLKENKKRLGYCAGIPLFFVAIVCNSYYFLVENSVIGKYVRLYLKVAVSARNGIFYGFFVLWVGFISYRVYKKNLVPSVIVKISFLVCYSLYLIELWNLKDKVMKDDGSIFIMSIPVTACLLMLSVRRKEVNNQTVILRNLSTGIYLLHRPILYILTIIQILFSIDISHEIQFFMVSCAAVIICCVAYKRNYRIARYLK